MKSRVKTYILVTIIAIISFTIPQGCSCDGNVNTSTKPSTRIKDREAYELGALHASRLLENVDNEDMVQDALLEVKARRTNIESKLGQQSASDYEHGFTDFIRQHCDSLARIIF